MPRKNQDNGEQQTERSRQRKQMSRGDANQLSMESHRSNSSSTDSDNNIIDMVVNEKIAAMDPEKSRHMSISIYRGNRDTAALVDDPEENESAAEEDQENDTSPIPGAYRVTSGRVQSSGGDSVTTSSVYSEGSASCVIVIPRAALVNDRDEGRGNDVEGQIKEIPLAIAEANTEASERLGSQPTKAGKRKARIFKISVLVCLTLVAVLLGGVLYLLLSPESNGGVQDNFPDDNRNPSGGGGGGEKKPQPNRGTNGNRLF
jgi:hypothetical protein